MHWTIGISIIVAVAVAAALIIRALFIKFIWKRGRRRRRTHANLENGDIEEFEMPRISTSEMPRISTFPSDSETGSVAYLTSAKHVIFISKNMFQLSTVALVNGIKKKLELDAGIGPHFLGLCGPQLTEALDELKKTLPDGLLRDGEVLMTPSFNYKYCKYILHTSPPLIYTNTAPTRTAECALRLCYFNTLRKAAENDIACVAFSVLGLGFWNWEMKHAVAVALQGIFAYFEVFPESVVKTVHLCTQNNIFTYEMAVNMLDGDDHVDIDNVSDAHKMRLLVEKSFNRIVLEPVIPLPETPTKVGSFVSTWDGNERRQTEIKVMNNMGFCSSTTLNASSKRNTTSANRNRSGRFSSKKTPKNQGCIKPRVNSPSHHRTNHSDSSRSRLEVHRILNDDEITKIPTSAKERMQNMRKRRRCGNNSLPDIITAATIAQKVVIMTSFLPENHIREGRSKLSNVLEGSSDKAVLDWFLQNAISKKQVYSVYAATKQIHQRCHSTTSNIAILFESLYMLHSDASNVLKALVAYCEEKKEYEWTLLESIFSENPKSVIHFLKKFSPCYNGVRTALKRVVELRSLAYLRVKIAEGFGGNVEALKEVLTFKHTPTKAQMAFAKSYIPFRNDNHHCEDAVRRRFGPLLEIFSQEIQRMETLACDVCNQLTTELFEKDRNEISNYLTAKKKSGPQQTFLACKTCCKSIRKGSVPPTAVINCMDVAEIPPIFKKLNWIEKCLIRLISPLQTIIHLRDIRGKKTAVKGTTGGMGLVPIPLTNTLDHVAESLPCAANLILQVSSSYTKSAAVVDLNTVLLCINYLKSESRYYEDVPVNPYFQFTKNKEVFFDKDEDDADLVRRSNTDKHYLLTQDDISLHPMRTVDIPPVSGLATEHYRLKSLRYKFLGLRHDGLEAKAFPWLFPNGRNHFDDPHRQIKLKFVTYIRARIMCANRLFATDMKWLCFAFGYRMQMEIANGMATQCKITREATAAEINKKINTDLRFSSSLNTIYGSFRGFAAYWNSVKLKLRSHIAVFGPPTWFITLNPAERDWKEILAIYSKFYPEANRENIQQLIAKDPLHFCRHFHHRVNTFFKKILVPGGPFGTVTHYFRRIEYQHRGTQHAHCLIWCKDRPGPDATPEEITTYIDSVVTARMPDEEKEPELYRIIKKHQLHWKDHSPTCMRPIKFQGKIYKMCRFEFPRPKLSKTVLTRKEASAILNPGCQRRKQYYLARTPDDVFVNDYSPTVSLSWDGNTDTQYVVDDTTDVVDYICGYVSKSEKAKGETIFGLKPGDSSFDNKRLFKNYLDLLRMKETGALEIIDILMGHHLYQFDASHVWIDTGMDGARSRVLVQSDIMQLEKDEQAFKDNWADIYYPQRPQMFEHYSLFNLMINFSVTSSNNRASFTGKNVEDEALSDEEQEDAQHAVEYGLEDDQLGRDDANNPHRGHYNITVKESPFFCHPSISKKDHISFGASRTLNKKVLKKHRAQVPRTFLPNPDGSWEVEEDYFRRLCMLFIPWRHEEHLKGDAPSFADRYRVWITNLSETSPEAYLDIRKYLAGKRALVESDSEKSFRQRMMKEALDALNIDEEPEDVIPIQVRLVDEDKHEENLENMNVDQERIFDHLMGTIELQDKARRLGTAHNCKPTLIFVSGTAGVGKSFLINNIADAITLKYCKDDERDIRPSVLLGAPTGLASINILGSTLHSLFNLDVQHGKNKEFKEATDEQVSKARALFANVRLIIIDEVSMCSAIMLTKLHLRMQRIAGNDKIFGGFNIVAFGDLLQLPPVQAPKVFEKLSPHTVANLFKSMAPPVTLWREFTYNELTINMRQRNDLEFANMMGRARVQALTPEDIKLFRTRLIPTEEESGIPTMQEAARYYLRILDKDSKCIALFSTNVEVMEFNQAVMDELEMDTFAIDAEDSITRNVQAWAQKKSGKGQLSRPYQLAKFSITADTAGKRISKKPSTFDESGRRSGGLVKRLVLSLGARVMLRRNVDVPRGLVNGSMGYLKDVVTAGDGSIVALLVLFDGHTSVTKIERATAVVDTCNGEYRRRVQFPITVAFAATIHKCQGMTVKNAIISTRSIFSPGQAFVAFSRVQNLEGLHLIDFEFKKVTVDKASLMEYNKRRAEVGLPPFPMPSSHPAEKTPAHPAVPPSVTKQAAAALSNISLITPGKKQKEQSVTTRKGARRNLFENPQNIVARRAANELLLIRNTGSDCFVITLVNLVNAMGPIAERIRNCTADDEMETIQLSRILNRTVTDCVSLRRLLPVRYHSGHRDTRDVMAMILQMFPDELWPLFNFSVEVVSGCGATSQCARREGAAQFSDCLALQAQVQPMTLSQILECFKLESSRCVTCGQPNNIERKIELLAGNKYLFCGIKQDIDGTNVVVLGSDAEQFELCGVYWRVLGASEYIAYGGKGEGGHYKTWIRVAEETYAVLNDNKLEDLQKFPREWQRFSILLLERIENHGPQADPDCSQMSQD